MRCGRVDDFPTVCARRALVLVAVLGLLAAPAGCSSKENERQAGNSRPCDPPVVEIPGLRASRPEDPPLTFETDGSGVWIQVSFQKTWGFFDPSSGLVYVGHADRTPTYDPRTGAVSNVEVQAHVEEGHLTELELPPGVYWLWATNGPEIVLSGCTPESVTRVSTG